MTTQILSDEQIQDIYTRYGGDMINCSRSIERHVIAGMQDRLHQRIRSLEREDFRADAHRLALELECILLDTEDTAKVSKWWDSGMEAIEQHRQLVSDVDKADLEQAGAAQKEQP